jgi:DNA polymerase III delta prime subunit
MSYQFRPSFDEQLTKAPTIALAGPTGSGKTESAMRLARGYCGEGVRFAVIDTEEKRALYKRNRYQPWDWLDMQPPFTPERYIEVLEAAKDYPAVVLDSGSHEWAGEGGCQDMQAEALERMAKGDPAKMERLSAPAWRGAKLEHKRFMHRLIRYPTLLIVCLRAEPKIKFVKDQQGRTQIVDAGYQPIAEKMFMYEMLVGAMMHSDNPGVPTHLKELEPELAPVFLAGKQIDEGTGERLKKWAAGGQSQSATAPEQSHLAEGESAGSPAYISAEDALRLEARCTDNGINVAGLKKAAGVQRISQILRADLPRADAWVDAAIAKRKQTQAA